MTALQGQGLWVPAVVLAGLLLSVSMERLARPKSVGLLRPFFSLAIHSGLWLVAWACCLAFLGRPIFAALAVLAGQFLVIQISNAKFRALREPFIFSDFGIFSQTVKHPRLYLPFLGIGRACQIAVAVAGVVGIGLFSEQSVENSLVWSGLAAVIGWAFLFGGLATSTAPSLDPETDLARHGLFASIAQYWLREKTQEPLRKTNLPSIIDRARDLPDIVVIQSESFFDPRAAFAGIRGNVLEHFDEARASAVVYGKLTVPAWGANTMRPEFAFLTGIEPASLDIHRFNPYRRVARRPIHALPAVLREAGYSTTCIHPHPARFFRRDRAFPNLGFERFLDIRQFRNASRCGPYIGDTAVTDKLLEEMKRANDPTFYFVVTMENHGPLHLESLTDREARELFETSPHSSCSDLGVYLRHLKNADKQLGRLRQFLHARTRPFILVFYGEHLPSMPAVYDALGIPDGRTDYFIEASGVMRRKRFDLDVRQLAPEMLSLVGNK